jgi:hypothetical protein
MSLVLPSKLKHIFCVQVVELNKLFHLLVAQIQLKQLTTAIISTTIQNKQYISRTLAVTNNSCDIILVLIKI